MARIKRRSSPFFELMQIQSRLHQLFDALAEARSAYASSASPSEEKILPESDVYETPGALVAVFELPGAKASSIRLCVEAGHLVVEGEKTRTPQNAAAKRFHCVERSYGKFRRAVAIACPVNSGEAKAVLAGGVLTVTMPKVAERRGRTVEIKVAS
jgi:HSP20 family protein